MRDRMIDSRARHIVESLSPHGKRCRRKAIAFDSMGQPQSLQFISTFSLGAATRLGILHAILEMPKKAPNGRRRECLEA